MIEWIKKLFRPRSEYKLVGTAHAFWVRNGKTQSEVFYHLLEDQYGNRKCEMSRFADAQFHPVYEGYIKSWLHGADISVVNFALITNKQEQDFDEDDDPEPEEKKPEFKL